MKSIAAENYDSTKKIRPPSAEQIKSGITSRANVVEKIAPFVNPIKSLESNLTRLQLEKTRVRRYFGNTWLTDLLCFPICILLAANLSSKAWRDEDSLSEPDPQATRDWGGTELSGGKHNEREAQTEGDERLAILVFAKHGYIE